jgi:3-oxoacyl-(acyl-carrier-protein) synthase
MEKKSSCPPEEGNQVLKRSGSSIRSSHSKRGMVRSFHPKDFIPASKIRRLDRASQFAIAASKLALADAQLSITRENDSSVGIVLGSGFCGLSSSEEFHRGQVLKGFLDLNPMLFPTRFLMPLPAMSPSNLESKGSILHWSNPSARRRQPYFSPVINFEKEGLTSFSRVEWTN